MTFLDAMNGDWAHTQGPSEIYQSDREALYAQSFFKAYIGFNEFLITFSLL